MQSPVKRKISQQDIAKDLGVSQALVSMVLNGRSKGIHRSTSRKILEHAKRLGYFHRKAAPGNAEGHAMTQVGFILRPGHTLYSQSSVFSHIQHGLHCFLESQGLGTLFLGTVDSIREKDFRNFSALHSTLLGVVVMGEVDREFLEQLKARFSRLVMVAANCHGCCDSVINNESQTMNVLVDHLVGLGHRSFAWVAGNAGSKALKRREEAFFQALGKHGLDCPPAHREIFENPKQRDGQEAARRILSRFGRESLPTAWICYNGRMARGAVSHLLACQYDIPGDVSIVACDGTYICEDEEPALTGAYADPEMIGSLAARLLLRDPEETGGTFTELIAPATLCVRQSSGPPPTIRKGR